MKILIVIAMIVLLASPALSDEWLPVVAKNWQGVYKPNGNYALFNNSLAGSAYYNVTNVTNVNNSSYFTGSNASSITCMLGFKLSAYDNATGEFTCSEDLLGGGSSGNPFDQSLNTTDSPTFTDLHLQKQIDTEACVGIFTNCTELDAVRNYLGFGNTTQEICEEDGCNWSENSCTGESSMNINCIDVLAGDKGGCNLMSECNLEGGIGWQNYFEIGPYYTDLFTSDYSNEIYTQVGLSTYTSMDKTTEDGHSTIIWGSYSNNFPFFKIISRGTTVFNIDSNGNIGELFGSSICTADNGLCSAGGNATWNEPYADTLYYSINNPFNYLNNTTASYLNDTQWVLDQGYYNDAYHPYIVNGTNGINGTNGSNGLNGTNGTNGVNGTNGTNGTDGTNAFNITNNITTYVNTTNNITQYVNNASYEYWNNATLALRNAYNNFSKINVTNTMSIWDSVSGSYPEFNLSSNGGFSGANPTINFANYQGGLTTARIQSQPGSGYTNSQFSIDVANSAKALVNRLIIDINGNFKINGNIINATNRNNITGMYIKPYANASNIMACDATTSYGFMFYNTSKNVMCYCNSTQWIQFNNSKC